MEDLYSVVSLRDESGDYSTDILIEDARIAEVERNGVITLKDGTGFRSKSRKSLISSLLHSRKNIVCLGRTVEEFPIKLREAKGDRCLTLVNSEQVNERIKKMKESDRSKIGWIHVSTIQILIKSTFRRGIHCPVRIVVIDNRMTRDSEKVIGIISGDLGYSVVKFNVTCNYAIPLSSSKFNNSLGLLFELERKDIMEDADIPFSITYACSYALSNSHHSVEFINKDKIVIDELFARTSTRLEPITRIPLPVIEEASSSSRLIKAPEAITEPLTVSRIRENLDRLGSLRLRDYSDKGSTISQDEILEKAPEVIVLPHKEDIAEIKSQVNELSILTKDLSRRI
ncbi:uncharacterized protein LOC116204108 [Punica granatum]|uniref:Uncharacterized protein LOC116204108 n=1 Tax=Punica granatum TaxID=22663 RepID=A0A6P8DBY7_PUNGR|nr:uncharacterized protein LOC116204108 [Punica granatum]